MILPSNHINGDHPLLRIALLSSGGRSGRKLGRHTGLRPSEGNSTPLFCFHLKGLRTVLFFGGKISGDPFVPLVLRRLA